MARVLSGAFAGMSDYVRTMQAAIQALQPAFAAFKQASETIATIWPALTAAVRAALPPNWNPDEVSISGVRKVAFEDGIPIAWVPHSDVVSTLMRAPDRAARLRILRSSEGSILRD